MLQDKMSDNMAKQNVFYSLNNITQKVQMQILLILNCSHQMCDWFIICVSFYRPMNRCCVISCDNVICGCLC